MNPQTTLSPRPRLLLLAYACSPVQGSECAVGWNRAVEAARYCDTWVMTLDDPEFRNEIEEYLQEHGPIPGLHFIWVPATSFQRALSRIPGVPYHLGYQSWHRAAYQVAERLHAAEPFDLVHQVSYCGYREPGYLWKLDAPFVWGPVGGTQNYPWRFLGQAGISGAFVEGLRTVLNDIQLRCSPRVRRVVQRSAALLTANSTNHRDFELVHGVQSIQQVETGLVAVNAKPRPVDTSPRPIRLLWSGQLYPLKALPLLLRAMAQLPDDVPCELRVLGEGPYREAYERLAKRLGVDSHIKWMGWCPHREALAQLDWADVFAFTSLRDTTGTVVLEALAAGVPIICLDHQGVHDIVTDDCGIKIPVTTPREVIACLATAISQLSSQPDERMRLSRGALERARDFLWSKQGARMADVYRRVLSAHSSREFRRMETSAAALTSTLSAPELILDGQEVAVP